MMKLLILEIFNLIFKVSNKQMTKDLNSIKKILLTT